MTLTIENAFYICLTVAMLSFLLLALVVTILNSLLSAYHDLFCSIKIEKESNVGIPVKKKQSKPRVKKDKVSNVTAKNGKNKTVVAVNSTTEFQAIETAEIEIPVIAADVLEYGPGELGSSHPEKTLVYYSPEALKDPDYLDTVVKSAIQIDTHEKNTSESNRAVDGWPVKAWFDEKEKRVKAKGIMHGAVNVAYVKDYMERMDKGEDVRFGTSAFIRFLKIDKEEGVSPEGKPYNAIVRRMVNNHIAILPNVRDENNVILALNALNEEPSKEDTSKKEISKENKGAEMPFTDEEFNAAMEKYNAKNKESEEYKNSIKNEILEEIEKKKETANAGGKNQDDEDKDKDKDKDKGDDVANSDDKDKDDATASNAVPSEGMIKDFSDALDITFKKTPTLKELGDFAGVTAKNSVELVQALNAKRAEWKKDRLSDGDGDAKNSKTPALTTEELLRVM